MGHPDLILQRIKKLAHDSSIDSDIRALAVEFLDLEQGVIKPLRQQVIALERRVTTLEAAAIRARSALVESV